MKKKITLPDASKNIREAVNASTEHPDYLARSKEWRKMRICMKGEQAIKDAGEDFLPRPSGMKGEYADAYEPYKERAHFPLVCSYALAGVLGVIITKMPEFTFPEGLEYLKSNATKDGRSIEQLFLDIIVEIFQTGRVPILVDLHGDKNEFRIVQYKAEDLINWKSSIIDDEKSISLAVIKQNVFDSTDIFSHSTREVYRAMILENDKYTVRTYDRDNKLDSEIGVISPQIQGRTVDELPIVIAGSISNSPEIQPIPLIPVANCSIQIYRKEADLANSEFLSCNPTLCITGVDDDEKTPNVVGSSVMITLPDPAARVFYTETDTAALEHVKKHIDDLYEEAIRHGVAILDSRKGVEAAEALRIRQATQSSSIYSIYLSALQAIRKCVALMCKWGGHDASKIKIDAPQSLTFGIPDSNVIRELIEGFTIGVFPLPIVHKYLISSGLLDQTISYDEYVKLIEENEKLKKKLGIGKKEDKTQLAGSNNSSGTQHKQLTEPLPKEVEDDIEGQQNNAN